MNVTISLTGHVSGSNSNQTLSLGIDIEASLNHTYFVPTNATLNDTLYQDFGTESNSTKSNSTEEISDEEFFLEVKSSQFPLLSMVLVEK